MTYLPVRGDRVQVLDIHLDDGDPRVALRDVVEVIGDAREYLEYDDASPTHTRPSGFVYLYTEGGMTWAKVERVQRASAPEFPQLSTMPADLPMPLVVPPADVKIVNTPPVFMSRDAAVRKRIPVASGFLKYFPDAIKCVSIVSRVGNDQHNPGQPIRWAKEKSADEADAGARHELDALSGEPQDPALAELDGLGHLAQKAWRAMAELQRACDAKRKAYEEGAYG